jgi:hypothetical protein
MVVGSLENRGAPGAMCNASLQVLQVSPDELIIAGIADKLCEPLGVRALV